MGKLYFRYGAMGSSKTANALMVRYNYIEKGQNAILLKPKTDDRDGGEKRRAQPKRTKRASRRKRERGDVFHREISLTRGGERRCFYNEICPL